MGMKSKSAHFAGVGAGGQSKREGGFKFKLNMQQFAVNALDPRTPEKGKKLFNEAESQALKNQIVELYRPGSTIGDGGTADALRYEISTGNKVGGKGHYIKAKERVQSLKRLINSGTLSANDVKIAKELIDDLEDAMKGWN